METKMMMLPAAYCVMTEEEMTYTEGGATMGQAICALFIGPYAWYKACEGIRDYRKKNPKNWTSTGMDALSNYMDKSTANTLFGIGCAYSFVAFNVVTGGIALIPTALIIFGK